MDAKKMVCPHCEALRNVRVVHRQEEIRVRKDAVTIQAEFYVCETCGGEFETSEQMEANLEAARNQYRTLHSIVSPREILALRERYDVSQKSFAKLLDIGDLTINGYEQGVLPSGAHNSLMKLATEPENFMRLYAQNKDKLSPRQRAKVDRRLREEEIRLEAYRDIHDDKDDASIVAETDLIYHGRPCQDYSRILDVIQLLISYSQAALYKMAVLKLLFYIDFCYYRRSGQSVTGWSYARLPHGPVPDDYKDILHRGEKCGRFSLEPDDEERGEYMLLPDDFDIDRAEGDFSPSEIQIIKEVVAKLARKSASTLRSLTHEEEAWIQTPHAKRIPYSYAASLKHGV